MSSRKLPRGVHKDDFARPLYRRDIFYSGSVLHVDKFHSAPNVHKYAKSVTSVPGSIEPERTYTLFHCIPISKASYDTLRQASVICQSLMGWNVLVLYLKLKRVFLFPVYVDLHVIWINWKLVVTVDVSSGESFGSDQLCWRRYMYSGGVWHPTLHIIDYFRDDFSLFWSSLYKNEWA